MSARNGLSRQGRWWRLSLLTITLACALLLGDASCSGPRVDAADVDAAERRWRETGWESYEIEVQVTDGLERRVEVTVRENEIESARLRERGERGWESSVRLTDVQAGPYTVRGLFQLLRQELISGLRETRADFDARQGYPVRIELAARRGARPEPRRVISVRRLSPLTSSKEVPQR